MASAVSAKSLTNDPIPATLWQMTWPVVIGVLTLISFNVVDTFFVGMLGTDPLAAVSFTFPVTFSVVSLAIGLGVGTSAVLARKRGAGNEAHARFDGVIALAVSALLVAGLSLFGFLLMDPIFAALQAQERLLPLIHEYMILWFAGATFLVIPMVGNAVLRASGDTRTPSIIMASGGLLNAIFDPILIFGFGPIPAMGVQGAALASVLSWSIGTVLVLWYLHYKGLISFKVPEHAHPVKSAKQILNIGLPAAGANMLTPLAMAVMTAIIAAYGAPAVAAFGVGTRLESLASVIILALSMSLPPLISQNLGAMQFERVRDAYNTALRSVIVVQLLIYVVLAVGAPYIAQIFTDDPEVARLIRLFLYIMPLGYGMQGIIILTNSSFNAMHEPMSALALSIVRLFVMFVPLSYIGSLIADIPGLFIGGVVANVLTAGIAWRWFQAGLRKQRNEEVA
ncbi:MATE family efflux transporter [Pseudidiomarina terrestris]|uniref:MATE family efflux transporter n=1 Tax=Pseudidiomarina terrestris TaxID=2820060 RepID=UPI00264F01CA|nr:MULTISPECIES: MATE family efflux transporter [unclassified Pseudidiomarina]MDN7126730.1 MATE family efflux transporter [Pseudidiomarina sp. 1APR75-33.1]MDN7134937.1 MATE family efflux transporter [Pseudidiomarina sp. 1ASP75-5]MDN7137616.1 MATE family efflux transporter [Pseudidiomarina sp. 1ASP75-14]